MLAAAAGTAAASRPGFQLAEGQVEQALGQQQAAETTFKQLLLGHPLSAEAQIARAKLTELGAEALLTTADLRTLAEAFYNAGRYAEAAEQFRVLERAPGLDAQTRNGFAVAEAACQLKLKRLTVAEAKALPDTADDNGARRLDLLMELARDRNDTDGLKQIIAEMETRFPHSPWLADALFSAGNMYMLKRDYPAAIEYYADLAGRFPSDKNASAAHWRSGWLSYRLGLYPAAEHIFDEQIRLYPGTTETVSALYWRGRLYETQDHNPAMAAANYRTIVRAYQHFFYAQMARLRLAALGNTQAAPQPQLDRIQPLPVPHLRRQLSRGQPPSGQSAPAGQCRLNGVHCARDQGRSQLIVVGSAGRGTDLLLLWPDLPRGARAQAGHSECGFGLHPIHSACLLADSLSGAVVEHDRNRVGEKQSRSVPGGLADPARVGVRSTRDFLCQRLRLMQLLPPVGEVHGARGGHRPLPDLPVARSRHEHPAGHAVSARRCWTGSAACRSTRWPPTTRATVALSDWQAAGPYSGIDEFVESIPFTQTREYVEAILRNEETYKAIDDFARTHGSAAAPVSH